MKDSIVEYVAGNAYHALNQACGETVDMKDKYPALFRERNVPGVGLDFAVLCEKIEEAREILFLLTNLQPDPRQ